MKKFLLSFTLVLIFLCSSCSCSGEKTLSFSTNHINSGYSFSREYSVSLVENEITGTYKKENADVYGEITMTGTYTVSFKSTNADELKDKISEEYRTTLSNIYIYTTKLELDCVYKKVSDTVYNDYIETTNYLIGNQSLSPIFTECKSKMSYIGNGSTLDITEITSDYITTYDESTYTVNKTMQEGENESTNTSTQYSYTKGNIIDNGYLLLALENLKIDVDSSDTVSVVTPAYGDYKSLSISCENAGTFTVNEVEYSNLKKETFKLTSNSSSCLGGDVGKGQIIYLAKDDSTQKIVKYIFPLTATDSSYSCLGSLVFDLK